MGGVHTILLDFLCESHHVITEKIREPEECVDFDAVLGEGIAPLQEGQEIPLDLFSISS